MGSLMMNDTGIVKTPGWLAKAWWSIGQHIWLVQIERYWPEAGGWVRGWLTTPPQAVPQSFATVNAAQAAACAFCAAPHLTRWQENCGVL